MNKMIALLLTSSMASVFVQGAFAPWAFANDSVPTKTVPQRGSVSVPTNAVSNQGPCYVPTVTIPQKGSVSVPTSFIR